MRLTVNPAIIALATIELVCLIAFIYVCVKAYKQQRITQKALEISSAIDLEMASTNASEDHPRNDYSIGGKTDLKTSEAMTKIVHILSELKHAPVQQSQVKESSLQTRVREEFGNKLTVFTPKQYSCY